MNLKYDAWQKELQGSFATILAEETRQVSASRVLRARNGRRGTVLLPLFSSANIVLCLFHRYGTHRE